jgi:hypothetical protein
LSEAKDAPLQQASFQSSLRREEVAAIRILSEGATEPAASGAAAMLKQAWRPLALGLGGIGALQQGRDVDDIERVPARFGGEQAPAIESQVDPSTSEPLLAMPGHEGPSVGQALLNLAVFTARTAAYAAKRNPGRTAALGAVTLTPLMWEGVKTGSQALWDWAHGAKVQNSPVTQSQEGLIETLALIPYKLPNGTWTSSLDAIRNVAEQLPDTEGGQIFQRVAEILHDVPEMEPLIGDNGGAELEVGRAPGAALTRHKRQVPNIGTTDLLLYIPGLGDITLREIVDAVQQYSLAQEAQDERLVLQALQNHWGRDSTKIWLSQAPESEQKLWISYLVADWLNRQEMDDVARGPQRLVRDRIQDALQQRGIQGDPDAYEVSLNHTVTVGNIGIPVEVRRTLTEVCLSGNIYDDLLDASIYSEGQLVSPKDKSIILDILKQRSLTNTLAERLHQFKTQRPIHQTRYAAILTSKFHKDILEAKLKGHITGGREAWLTGLDIVLEAMRDSLSVETGTLSLSTGSDGVSLSLSQWLVLVRKDKRGQEDGVVLYRPETREWAVYPSQQVLFQHLDISRLSQQLFGELAGPHSSMLATVQLAPQMVRSFQDVALEAAHPVDRPALLRFFDDIRNKPSLWQEQHLQFHSYDGHDFQGNMYQWAAKKLDLYLEEIEMLVSTSAQSFSLIEDQVAVTRQLQSFTMQHIPPLREFARRKESDKLTAFFHVQNLIVDQQKIDPDTIFIEFNNKNMTWTDWVLEGYRQHGDNVFAISNNFIRDSKLTTSDSQVTAQLNRLDIKQSVQQNLRSTYVGDDYIEHLKALLTPADNRYQYFQNLRVASQVLSLQRSLEAERATGSVPEEDYLWLKSQFNALPGSISGDTEVAQFRVNGKRIPGVLVFSKVWRQGPDRGHLLRQSFIFLPDAPYGRSLYKLDADFLALLKSEAFKIYITQKVLIKDQRIVEDAIRGMQTTNFRASLYPVADFRAACDQWILDLISNTEESSTSKAEVVREQMLKGLRFAVMGTCAVGSGGAAAALCSLGTAALIGDDISSAADNLKRGDVDAAFWDLAFVGLDVLDMGPGLRAIIPKALLKRVGKTHFTSLDEAKAALETVTWQVRGFASNGAINDEFSLLNPSLSQLLRVPRPGRARTGDFYEWAGKSYIHDHGRVFEVYSDNAWMTVRVRDPRHPQGHGAPITYRKGQWQLHDGGLNGGGALASYFRQSPEQRLRNALLEYISPNVDRSYIEGIRESLSSMSNAQLSDLVEGLGSSPDIQKLTHQINVWGFVNAATEKLVALSALDFGDGVKRKFFDSLVGRSINRDRVLKFNLVSDPRSGLILIVFADAESKKMAKLNELIEKNTGIVRRAREDAIAEFVTADRSKILSATALRLDISLDAALAKFLENEDIRKEFAAICKRKVIEYADKENFYLFSMAKEKGLDYVIAYKGRAARNNGEVVFSEELEDFRSSLSKFAFPLEIEEQSKVAGKKSKKGLSSETSQVVLDVPAPSPVKIFDVEISPLAEMQMQSEGFSSKAKRKIDEIIEDIEAGRVTRKNIGRNIYYDLPGLGSGGRGEWRAAFSREKSTYHLRGFYDYHNGKFEVWNM